MLYLKAIDLTLLNSRLDLLSFLNYVVIWIFSSMILLLFFQDEVRKLATDFVLPNKDRKDSQGICFLGKVILSFVDLHFVV